MTSTARALLASAVFAALLGSIGLALSGVQGRDLGVAERQDLFGGDMISGRDCGAVPGCSATECPLNFATICSGTAVVPVPAAGANACNLNATAEAQCLEGVNADCANVNVCLYDADSNSCTPTGASQATNRAPTSCGVAYFVPRP